MSFYKTTVVTIAAYITSAVFLFGGVFQPINLLFRWNDRLGVPFWPLLLVLAIAMGGIGAKYAARSERFGFLTGGVFVVISMISSVLLVGAYAESKRTVVIESFRADHEIRHWFVRSLREAPRDFQFFLHGMALKDCVPYAWSYRTMSFYPLAPNTAANVLPSSWIEMCEIKREY